MLDRHLGYLGLCGALFVYRGLGMCCRGFNLVSCGYLLDAACKEAIELDEGLVCFLQNSFPSLVGSIPTSHAEVN